MSTAVQKPATTPIPVQLSATEFTAFILPHLSMPKPGPKCKVGYHCVFNFILRVLYTGMQWKCLPIDLSVLHGDGTNTVAKKGGMALATRGTNTRRARRSWPSPTIMATC